MKAGDFGDKFPAAGYIRLSREDGDREESDSVMNQKKLIQSFLASREDLELEGFYVDDGFTGTNFERPGFQRMLRDIRGGKIRCVVVKDDCVIIEPTQKDLENQGFVAGSICF